MIFTVFGLDFLFRNKIIGYGVTNLPLFFNNITKVVKIYELLPLSKLSGFVGYLLGKEIKYQDQEKTLTQNKGREYTRVQQIGEIFLEVEVESNKNSFSINTL